MRLIQVLKEKFLNKNFLTFGLIGGANTLIANVLYILFIKKNISAGTASALGDILSMVFSYIMNMKFTYHEKLSWKSALTFPLSYLPGVIISAIMVVLVVDIFQAPKIFAKLLSLPLYIPLNFLCMNFIVRKFSSNK